MLKKVIAFIMAAAVALSLFACNNNEAEEFKLSFSAANSRGNTNGNIANMGLGAQQGDSIIFTDMGDGGRLKVTSNGRYSFAVMEDLQDIFACINLVGYKLDYISLLYSDINTVDLSDMTASSLIAGNSYCLQAVDGVYYYIDESGDGGVYRLSEDGGESERLGSHAVYAEDTSDASSHPSFSVDGSYLYYAAADDDFHIYRVDLRDNSEIKLSDASASMLIAEASRIFYVDKSDRRLYELGDGKKTCLTDCKVGTFNFDSEFIYYTDASKDGSPVMRMELNGKNPKRFCNEKGTMYISIFGEVIMLYCVEEDGSNPRTLFADKKTGETYQTK